MFFRRFRLSARASRSRGSSGQSVKLWVPTTEDVRRDFVLHRQQHATDVDVADLMVVLDRLLGGEQADLALDAGVVERDVQSTIGADGLFDERDGPKLLCIPCLTRLSPLSTIAHEPASVSA
jgi:hypothetical protein